nr:hypothetical protein [Prolixibacteraceae bacterium]
MKRFLITTMLFCLVLLSAAQEQGIDSKRFYLKAGISGIGPNFYGLNDAPDDNFRKEVLKNTKINAYNFEVGSLFGIDMIDLGDQYQVGIDVNYLTVNYVSLSQSYDNEPDEDHSFFEIGSAIGPVFTYAPTKSFELDVFFKLNPTWISGDVISYGDQPMGYLGFKGMKYKMGLNARFDFLMLSAEFNPGYTVLQDWD